MNLESRSHGHLFEIKMKKWDVLTLDFLWIMTAATKIAAMTITRTTERT